MALINYFNNYKYFEDRIEAIVATINKLFNPSDGGRFSILDPYLNPVSEIQYQFDKSEFDSNIWPFFFSQISDKDIVINIITMEHLLGLRNPRNKYPIIIEYPDKSNKLLISICRHDEYYPPKLKLHDRWILYESSSNVLNGIHIGPSLGKIDKRDVTITRFSDSLLIEAKKSFNDIWNNCLKNYRIRNKW